MVAHRFQAGCDMVALIRKNDGCGMVAPAPRNHSKTGATGPFGYGMIALVAGAADARHRSQIRSLLQAIKL
jgi:hypothetical protein